MTANSEPFGSFRLQPWRESLRRLAERAPNNRLGMWMISILRKLSLLGHEAGMNGPLDVNVAKGVLARLYPGSNRCEKRAYAGVHIWDARERGTLGQAISDIDNEDEFVFLDVGANIGLYSLFVGAMAENHQCAAKIIAVEPDPENRSRLTFNLDANNCKAVVEAIGISDAQGSGVLTEAHENRGGISVLDAGEGEVIELDTLAGLITRHGLTRVDAMKLDIEGRDLAALQALLKEAPNCVWPRLLIVETGRDANSAIVELLKKHGYRLQERAGINSIMKLDQVNASAERGQE